MTTIKTIDEIFLESGITPDDHLEHHGVRGMKWGVRRDRPSTLSPSASDSSVTKKVKEDYNNLSDSDFRKRYATSKATYAKRVAKKGDPYAARSGSLKKAEEKMAKKRNVDPNALDKKHPSDVTRLSDADLRAAVSRMQLERQFSQLQMERVSKGESLAKQLLKEIGKQQVRRVAAKAADLAVEEALRRAGVKTNNPALGELAKRMKPKKK